VIQEAYLQVQGLRTHYYHAGENGSSILLLHGGGSDTASLSWRLAIPTLASSHRVYAPNLPGYGQTDRPDIAYTNDYYVQFVCDFMEAAGLERAALVGISMGGGISIGMTLEYPERVDRLVLVDSYGLQRKAPMHLLSALTVKTPGLIPLTWKWLSSSRGMMKASLKSLIQRPQSLTGELIDELWEEARRPRSGDAFYSYQKSEVQWGGTRTCFMDRLDQIEVPTLIIHGEKDSLVPLECSREAARRIPNAELKILPGCGHWPQRDHPEEFNRVLAAFLNGS